MRVIIDRFEEEFAVVELPDQTMLHVPKALFENAHEGDAAEITVLGRPYEQESEESQNPSGLFEKLRKKSNKKKKADNPPEEV
ncbi:MAG: DUF3006 domain-containing protein [Ruminococcus sp.]|nr:DUF3006 domain-containing protein [Ruminococcus sp.]